jgi:hypothetical protein
MSVVDVTPAVGGPMAGYGDRGRSTGVLDPICAVAAIVEGSDDRVCIVALDALGVRTSVADRLRAAVAVAAGVHVQSVALSCTHNHAGPDWFDQDLAGIESADHMIHQVAAAVRDLAQELQEVTAAFALTETAIGVYRRVDGDDGLAVMGANPDGPIDRRVGTLVFSSAGGNILGTVTVATAHANCLKGDNTCLSADFVGAFRDQVSKRTGAPAMFIQGAAGDINAALRGDHADARQVGLGLGDDVLRGLANAEPLADRVAVLTRQVRVPFSDLPERRRAEKMARIAHSEWGQPVGDWLDWHARANGDPGSRALPADLTVVRIGEVYIGGVPWELFSQTALDVSESCDQRAFLCGYVNGYYGYLAPAVEHARGGYEIEWMPIVYGLGTDMPLPMACGAADLIHKEFVDAVARLGELGRSRRPGHVS